MQRTVAGVTVNDAYDLANRVVAQFNSSGGWDRGEVYAGSRHLATYADSTTSFDFGDSLGTERAVMILGNSLQRTCSSDPWGSTLNCSGSAMGSPNPVFLTGKPRDPDGHCCTLLREWLNVVSVSVSAGADIGISGQAGVVEHRAEFNFVKAEVKSGLGGGNFDSHVQTGGTLSVTAGSVSAKAYAMGDASAVNGLSVAAGARVSVPGGHAGIELSTAGGLKTSIGAGTDGKTSDVKIGGEIDAVVGVGVSADLTQAGKAWNDTISDVSADLNRLLSSTLTSGPGPSVQTHLPPPLNCDGPALGGEADCSK